MANNENRVRFVGEFSSRGAEKLKQDIAEARDGQRELNAVIGQGGDVAAAAASGMDASSQAAQDALRSVESSLKSLETAFAALPAGTQRSLNAVVQQLQDRNFVAALEQSTKVVGVPQNVHEDIYNIVQQGNRMKLAGEGELFTRTLRTLEPEGAAPHAGTRAPDEPPRRAFTDDEPARPTPILRSAVDALKTGDLEAARTHQQLAARTALRTGDREGSEMATHLGRALREHGDRDDSTESAERYQRTIERLEERLETAEAADRAPTLVPKVALGRAHRMLSTVDASLQGGINRASELSGLERNLGRAHAYVQQAERGGAQGREIDDLKEQLERLTEALGKTRESYEQGRREGGSGNEPRLPDVSNGGSDISQDLLGEFRRFASAGMGGGIAGRLLTRLGPWGMAAGAAGAANSLADRFIAGPNLEARERYTAEVDLARQMGFDQEPLEMFRSPSSGLSTDELVQMGYTSLDAERTLATLDTPAAGRMDLPREDVMDILRLSKSTGLSESALTDATRTLYESGVYEVGEAQQPLEVIKAALSEAVKNGVSQADTLRNLVSLTEQGLREGRSATPEQLAFQAALQAGLAGTGSEALRGDAGAGAQQGLNALVTGGNDPALEMMLLPAVEGVTPEQLGLEGAAAEGLRDLEAYSPMAAGFEKIRLAANNPRVMARLATRFEDAMGGNLDLLNTLFEQYGLGPEQRLAILGEGFGEIYRNAAAESEVFGEDLSADVQGANRIDQGSRRVLASERDTQETRGSGTLAAVGDVGEIANRGKRAGTRMRRNVLSRGGLYDDANRQVINDEGSLRTEGDEVRPPDRQPTPFTDQGTTPPAARVPERPSPETPPVPLTRALPMPEPGVETAEPVPIPMPEVEAEVVRPRTVPPRRRERRPGERAAIYRRLPPRRAADTAEDAFGMLGATAVTTTPGEVYGESLRGTPAEWLIGSRHRGVDLRIGEAGRPDPITSPWEKAKVIGADHSETLGNWMIVEAQNGSRYQFGHLNDDKGERMIGQTLRRGDIIGTEGTTGSSTGYHLDFRLLEEDDESKRINKDPAAFYQRYLESVNSRQPEATQVAPQEMHVRVSGLESMHVQVEGLTPDAARQAEGHLKGFTEVIRSPRSHRGYG